MSRSSDSKGRAGVTAFAMNSAVDSDAIHRLLHRLPQWLRTDLASSDSLQRERAEEALLAMLMACLDTLDRPYDRETP